MSYFGEPNALLKNTERLLEFNKHQRREKLNGQSSIFSKISKNNRPSIRLDEYPGAEREEKLAWEKEMLGLYITDHPFKDLLAELSGRISKISDVKQLKENESIKIGGVISFMQKVLTKNGTRMLFAGLEDSSGWIEMVVFPKIYEKFIDILYKENKIIIKGRLNFKEGQTKVIVEEIKTIQDFKNKSKNKLEPLIVKLDAKPSDEQFENLKALLKENPGQSSVYFHIQSDSQKDDYNKVKINLLVKNSSYLKKKIDSILNT